MAQAKNWCFTLNNPDYDELELADKLVDAVYAVFQLEIGENGTPHYQGYCMFSERLRLSQVRVYLATAHWETAKGTLSRTGNIVRNPKPGLVNSAKLAFSRKRARVNEMTLLNFIPLLRMDCDTPTMSNSTSTSGSNTPTFLRTISQPLSYHAPPKKKRMLGSTSDLLEQAKADSLIDTLSLSSETWSSESSQESGGMDIEERKPSYGTIFEDITALSQTLNFVLIDTPFEWKSKGLHVIWRPTTSSSQQTTTRVTGGRKR